MVRGMGRGHADPVKDQYFTPKNLALIVIDYQAVQMNSIASTPIPLFKCHR